ncbi:TIGR00282 family metallophosphoesterase [bacterium]|nr:TIGR00282 family metallophosphoesterase [bacterium]
MRIALFGDVVGRPGRTILLANLPKIKAALQADFCVVNAENAAGGSGLTVDIAKQLLSGGVDVITLGDHAFRQKDYKEMLSLSRVVRPANATSAPVGVGYVEVKWKNVDVAVINLQGQTFMQPSQNPFLMADEILKKISSRVIVVDFHAEATSEKIAMGHHLNGRVSIVAGTHTHVQTSDAKILHRGTAYITDLGMVGPEESVIGREVEPVLNHFLTGLPQKFQVADGPCQVSGALVEVDEQTGIAKSIQTFSKILE